MTPAARRALVGVADQGLYSGSNFLLSVFVASHVHVSAFGVFAVIQATYLIGSGLNRGVSAEPLLIGYSAAPEAEWQTATRAALARSWVFGIALALGGLVAALVVGAGSTRQVIIVFSVAVPVLFTQDTCRYAAIARARPQIALISDAVGLVLQVALSLIVARSSSPGALLVGVWASATAAGLAVAIAMLGLAGRRPWASELPISGLGARIAVDNLVTQGAQQGSTYVIAAIAGLVAAAGVRAAQVIFVLPVLLALGIQTILPAELARKLTGGTHAFMRIVRLSALAVSVATAAWLAVVLLLPNPLGHRLFGQSWSAARPLLLLVGLSTWGAALAGPAIAGLRVLHELDRTLWTRTIGLIVYLVALVVGGWSGGAKGAVLGLLISSVAQCVAWWAVFLAAVHRSPELGAGRAPKHARVRVRETSDATTKMATTPDVDPARLGSRPRRTRGG